MRILVTGGFGFIGSHFVRNRVIKGNEVVIIDKLTYAGNKLNLSDLDKNCYKFKKLDISNNAVLNKFLRFEKKFDLIVHFAAESHVDRSISNGKEFIKSNVIGTFNLLEGMRNGAASKMIHISTDEVYGSLSEGSWDELSNLDPRSPYSASKASSDLLCLSYINTYDLNIVITRCANNFGTHQSPEKFIPNSIIKVTQGKKLPIYGNGRNKREWIHVSDHIKAINLIAEAEKNEFRVYNISGEEMENLELAKIISMKLTGNSEFYDFVPDRKGHDFRYSIDSRRIECEFGWKLKSDFKEEIEETINWYLQNPDWVNNSMSRLNL